MAQLPRLAALTVGAALLASAPAHADVSGPDIVTWLNAQRAANGIPAGIVEDPALSDGCRKHNHYGALNELTHFDDKNKPGYTPEGETARRELIRANMERWRWMPRSLGQRHLLVNVPAFTAAIVDDGRVTRRHRTVVGARPNMLPRARSCHTSRPRLAVRRRNPARRAGFPDDHRSVGRGGGI